MRVSGEASTRDERGPLAACKTLGIPRDALKTIEGGRTSAGTTSVQSYFVICERLRSVENQGDFEP